MSVLMHVGDRNGLLVGHEYSVLSIFFNLHRVQ